MTAESAAPVEVLLPCPFCGSEASIKPYHDDDDAGGSFYFVQCGGCGAWTPNDDYSTAVWYWNRRIATAVQRAGVAEGWVLVPREPTREMLSGGVDNLFGSSQDDWDEEARLIWSAMLAATPPPPEPARPDGAEVEP